MNPGIARAAPAAAKCCCLEWAESQPGHWRGRAKIRLEMAHSLGGGDPASDHHLRMAAQFEAKAVELERGNSMPVTSEPMVVAATEMVGGEFVVVRGDVLGPVVARFPRTAEGHQRALRMAAGEGRS